MGWGLGLSSRREGANQPHVLVCFCPIIAEEGRKEGRRILPSLVFFSLAKFCGFEQMSRGLHEVVPPGKPCAAYNFHLLKF